MRPARPDVEEALREICPTAQVDSGINWVWASGLSKDQAEQFVQWLDLAEYEHRGTYPPVPEVRNSIRASWAVRFR